MAEHDTSDLNMIKSAVKADSMAEHDTSELMKEIESAKKAGLVKDCGFGYFGSPETRVVETSAATPDKPGVVIKKTDTTVKDEVPASSKIVPPVYKPPRNVEEFIQQNKDPRLSPEEQKASARRERTNKVIAGVGDMLSALSNMYFATQGAPNSYNPQNAMLPKMQARYDQLTKDHEARVKDYTSGLQRARQLDQQYQLTWEQLKRQYDRDRVQEERYQQQEAARKAQAEEKERAEDQKNQYRSLAIQFKDDPYKAAYYHALSQGRTQEQAELEGQAVQASYNAKQSEKNRKKTTQTIKKNNKVQKQTTEPSLFKGMKRRN